jgi:hypothetical protein
MKNGWIALCLMVVLAGCGRKEIPPVEIRIIGGGATEVDGVRRTPRELQAFLRARLNRHGWAPIILVAETNTPYASMVPARDVALSSGYWQFMLRIAGTTNTEEFYTHPGDGPPSVDIDVDVMNKRVMVDGESTDTELASLLAKPTNRRFLVWLCADATTTAGELFDLLRVCNRSDRTTTYIVKREDRIANKAPEDTSLHPDPQR